MEYLMIASGAYLVSLSILLATPNFRSAVVLRVIPGAIGVALLIFGMHDAGLLQ
jgi:hypothetical protein